MANEYLQRTPTSTGNQRVWTWSCWIKQDVISSPLRLFSCYSVSPTDQSAIQYGYRSGNSQNGALRLFNVISNTMNGLFELNNVLRDHSGWYHLLVSVNTTSLISNDRIQIFINGSKQNPLSSTYNAPVINEIYSFNSTSLHTIGSQQGISEYLKSYITDIFFIDGQALTPDVFGFNKPGKGYISVGSTQATDFRPGQWVPKKPRVIITEINRRGGFGVNGFYLPMNDGNNFGADFHCTPNSIIKLQENLPQPRCRIDGVGDYTGALRDDPFKQYLVLALPFVSGGLQNGFGDYSAAIRGSGTPKTITNNNTVISTFSSYYGSAGNFTSSSSSYITTPRNISDYNMESGDFTVEGWVYFKSINTGQYTRFFSIGNTSNEGIVWELNQSTSTLTFCTTIGADYNAVTTPFAIVANQWYHIAQVRKGTTYSAYINGVCIGIDTSINGAVNFNSNTAVVIGAWEYPIGSYARFADAYMQDIRIYKGVAKYTGGFDVPRPYTPVGISTWRAVPDTTANNFCTWNPLYPAIGGSNSSYSDGNLTILDSTANGSQVSGTIGVSTGKWYYEARATLTNVASNLIGIRPAEWFTFNNQNRTSYRSEGSVYNDAGTVVQSGTTYTTGDIIGIAFDMNNRRLWFSKNGSWVYSGDPNNNSNPAVSFASTYTHYTPAAMFDNVASSEIWHTNFGQNPTFSGQTTAGTFTDSNGKGLFKYQPPAGFLALCEDNLPKPAIEDPGKHFKTVLYTGSGTYPRNIVGIGFTPDLIWIKDRSVNNFHRLYNSVSGPLRGLYSNATNAETAENIQSFDADGFTLNTDSYGGGINNSGNNHVAWCWRAGAGTTSTNTDGSITSVVSVNRDAGFSIVSYTGAGTNTVGHGLGRVPAFIIMKARNEGTAPWAVYHRSLGATTFLNLNTTGGSSTSSGYWNNTEPTSSVFTIGSGWGTYNYINYCWAEIEGFSKFGSYVGNGSADGPFVYCGFKPAFVLIKRTNISGENWLIYDCSRNSTNPTYSKLAANSPAIENDATIGTDTQNTLDLLSNGFKLRTTNTGTNASGGSYIFAAFAESPFTVANSK